MLIFWQEKIGCLSLAAGMSTGARNLIGWVFFPIKYWVHIDFSE